MGHKAQSSAAWHVGLAKLGCVVPDCTRKATAVANISINNSPKKRLPVCPRHANDTHEDALTRRFLRKLIIYWHT